MNETWIIGAALVTPLLAMVGIGVFRQRPNAREAVSLVAAAILFGLAAWLVPGVADGGRPELILFEFLPGIALGFRVEPLGLGFALIASFLWFITTLYSIGYMRAHNENNQTRFYLFFALALGAVIGAAFASNLITLYVFYEALTLSTIPLVTHSGGEKSRRAGRVYVGLLLGTSLTMMLIAIAWIWTLTGTTEFVDGGVFTEGGALKFGVTPGILAALLVLMVLGTGKAGLMPFHRWLPAAMVAPTPVSALLHAVAVVKLGVFTVLKVTIYTFGIETLSSFDIGRALMYLAAFTLIAAGLFALREDNLKRRLAYSTISQLAYIVLGAMLVTKVGAIAGGMQITAHAFAKITLFFCAGAVMVTLHKTKVSEMNGVGRIMPITMTAFLVASLSVAGLPFTGGFWGKWYLALGALETDHIVMFWVILAGSLLSLGYLLPPAVRAFYGGPKGIDQPPMTLAGEARWPMVMAISITAVITVLLFFAAEPIFGFLDTIDFRGR
jgi:multicomponent Na+:H+ antiporter subunit D